MIRLNSNSTLIASLFTIFLSPITFSQDTVERTYFYYEVDELPVFETSNDQLNSYIYKNLVWPKMFDGEGELVISFDVDSKGNIKKIKVLKSLCTECDDKVKEIFENMSSWKPGIKDGKPVNVRMYVSVAFVLR